MFNELYQVNDQVSFMYSGKLRTGRIEKMTDTVVTLELEDGTFKSFRFDRMGS